MRHCAFALLAFFVTAAPAAAQRPVVRAGDVVNFEATHDTANTVGYRVFLCQGAVATCGQQVGTDLPLSVVTNGVLRSSLPAQSRGTYTLQLSAFNEDNEARSNAVVFDVRRPAPAAPGNLRVVTVQQNADGTQTIKLMDLEELADTLAVSFPEAPAPATEPTPEMVDDAWERAYFAPLILDDEKQNPL